jgi:hypothetical protein
MDKKIAHKIRELKIKESEEFFFKRTKSNQVTQVK